MIDNSANKTLYKRLVAKGIDGGSEQVTRLLRPCTADPHKVRLSAYTSGISEILRFNPENFQPKRQSMMNFSGTEYDFVNNSAKKTSKEQICFEVSDGKQTQLMRYHSMQDPGIGLG